MSYQSQQEWLTEDLAQIRRYFPGAEYLEAIETPFSLTTRPIKPHSDTEIIPSHSLLLTRSKVCA